MSDSDYRQHMAEYFRMRADGSSSPDYSPDDNHPTDGYEPAKATPSEIEWGAEGQYEPTTNYSLDGYTPIDSVVVEAPLGHGVAFDLGAEGRPYPDASVGDIFEDLPRQNAEISGVDFQADNAIIEGTQTGGDRDEIYIEPLAVQEGRSLDGYTAMDSVVEQAPLGYGVPQWYGRAEGSAGDQVVSWEDGAGVSSPSAPPSDIMWAEARVAFGADGVWIARATGEPDAPYDQGYDDQQDESIGERHQGAHEQSLKDRRDEADAMDRKTGRKYHDVGTMDSEHHKGQGYDDELDESLGMSHKESGMKQSFNDRRDESKGTEKFDDSRAYSRVKAMDAEMDGGKDWNMGLTQYAGSAGGSGAGTPVNYGGIALPESAVADLVESSSDNPLDASMGTVMGTMGAETALARKKSKNPSARQRGRAATQGIDNDPCNKSDRACPQDKALWQKSKQRASKEYRVWPSPHASAYAVQLYNTAGGKWKGASTTAHPKAKKTNLGKNSLGNYYDGNYDRKGDKGKAVDFSDKKTHVTHGDCGRAYTKDMSPAEFRKSFPRCLPQSGAAGMTEKGQKKETLNKRARLNKRKFRGGKGVSVPVDRKAGKKKK